MRQLPLISVVDDDASSRESLPDLLQLLGFACTPFASAEEFLASNAVSETRCLILDVSMPGMSGPELQSELYRRGAKIPIIFITAHCDSALRAELIARGAID
jgi:FixJ family two-component response regulator